eukprot:7846905-Pyramimonas_sp.AAC.1
MKRSKSEASVGSSTGLRAWRAKPAASLNKRDQLGTAASSAEAAGLAGAASTCRPPPRSPRSKS